MPSKLLRLARTLARTQLFRGTIAFVIPKLPVKRLIETEAWVAFHHLEPGYPFHVLLVPKQAIQSLAELGEKDGRLLAELFQVVQQLVARFDLERRGYRLIVNGGKFQDVPILHFHLISDDPN